MPKDTRLNRHIAIFGASGTMKSRAIIRNALFQALKRGESVVITDPKAELYNDTSQMYRNAGYEVRVFNLVNPEHGDSWNCMSDLHGNTLMAQMLTNIIIGNTINGKGDHFWDNGEGNLLKARILLVDLDPSRSLDTKHLPAVYQMLTRNSERQLTALFEKLPLDHPARAPYNLFAQSSDTVRSGIIQGLDTRLQVLQNREVQGITSRSDIDLAAPGSRKCAYYNVTFAYDRDVILKKYNLQAGKGQIVSIHGASGSGKSTILKLLMRFWDVKSGKVEVSGENVQTMVTKKLREYESFVTQDTDIFHDSIAANIAIGKPDATREEIIRAAKKASLHDFVMSLPKGYDTEVGELGDTLSGGERQRIGIARAFLHDAPLLLLDEPTSFWIL